MGRQELEIRGTSEGVLFEETSLAGRAWKVAKYNPYVSLAAGPVAGWLTGWGMISAWDSYTIVGTLVQQAVAPLIVMLFFVVRGALLFSRGGKEKQPEIGAEHRVLLALRETGGRITPVEAAIQTSLPVGEAERILSRLAGRGHLSVENRCRTLRYALPAADSGNKSPNLGIEPVPE